MAKEIQKKNDELEKERHGKGGGLRETDPLGVEVNLDLFLFGAISHFSLANNTKLSLLFKGRELNIAG